MEVCVLTSGSCGNCIYIGTANSSVVIDIGLSRTYLRRSLGCFGKKTEDLDAILLTHEHSDHVRGLSDVVKDFGMPVYATCGTWSGIKFGAGKFRPENVNLFASGDVFYIKDMKVESFRLSHDAVEPVGYRITDEYGASVGIATDTGFVTPEVKRGITGADVIVLESNYDEDMLLGGGYPWHLKMRVGGQMGHLSNKNCGVCLGETIRDNTRYVFLAHLSAQNNTPCIAFDTTKKELFSRGIVPDVDVDIITTKRYEMCEPVVVGNDVKRRLFS